MIRLLDSIPQWLLLAIVALLACTVSDIAELIAKVLPCSTTRAAIQPPKLPPKNSASRATSQQMHAPVISLRHACVRLACRSVTCRQ